MMNMPIRIVIVDAQQLFREGVAALLTQAGGFEVVGQAAKAGEVISVVETTQPHIVLTSFILQAQTGFDVARNVSEISSDIPIAMLVDEVTDILLMHILRSRVSGVIAKSDSSASLIAVIQTIVSKKEFGAPDHVIRRLPKVISHFEASKRSLSEREVVVLLLLAQGKPSREIAQILNISTKTIDSHREHIKLKLNIRGGAESYMHAARVLGVMQVTPSAA